jgi:uncharacterized membrane protein
MQQRRRFMNPAQPQTLQIAVFLLYANAVILAFYVLVGNIPGYYFLFSVGDVLAGYGIANEKKWGYGLGVFMAILPFIPVILALINGDPIAFNIIGLMFDIALVALLLHPQSRDYQRIWFK